MEVGRSGLRRRARRKSDVGDLKVFDQQLNPALLDTLNLCVVMVGLNISRGFADQPFRNFHDPGASANDFKSRYAFAGTSFWGAYMTDIIKGVVEPKSEALVRWLRRNGQAIIEHVTAFRSELSDLGQPRPVILAFGSAAHDLLAENLPASDYAHLVRLTHYSHRVSKEKYRETVHEQLRALQQPPNIGLQPTAAGGILSRRG
jgi:hypothetical protein